MRDHIVRTSRCRHCYERRDLHSIDSKEKCLWGPACFMPIRCEHCGFVAEYWYFMKALWLRNQLRHASETVCRGCDQMFDHKKG